jgi:hypothetical protein
MNIDRTMADVARLAVACWWWSLACAPRPLSSDSPAEDDDAAEAWERARDMEQNQAMMVLAGVRDQRTALALLAGTGERSVTARRHAIHAIDRVGGRGAAREVSVHGFGEGWRDLPRPVLYPGVVARAHAARGSG